MSIWRRSLFMLAVAAVRLPAQSCPAGRLVADFGYEFVSCVGCLSISRVGQLEYTRFTGEPVLHKIRTDGPGAGKILDQDTVVTVGGYPVTSIEAAMLLADWQPDPVELALRRNGAVRRVEITAEPMCVASRGFTTQTNVPTGGRLGVAIECVGCRITRVPNTGGERWIYPAPPALARVLADGPGARAGLMRGDTLTAIDGISILSPEAGDRLGSIAPGRPMQWTVRRGGRTIVATIVPEADRAASGNPLPPQRRAWVVDGVSVDATGRPLRANRDEKTGTLTISGDSLTVIVRPALRGKTPR